jgi:hypothetical protein
MERLGFTKHPTAPHQAYHTRGEARVIAGLGVGQNW